MYFVSQYFKDTNIIFTKFTNSEFILFNTINSFSMKSIRPFTAEKYNRQQKQEAKIIISKFNRPSTAKSTSLKQIIQVIQNTLNQGAHTILSKAKTLDKFSKTKQNFDFAKFRKYKQHTYAELQFPHFNTQLIIRNSSEIQKSPSLLKSTKKILHGLENAEFIPYNKKTAKIEQIDLRVDKSKLQKGISPKMLIKQGKCRIIKQKQKGVEQIGIDRWADEPSILHMSFLLHNSKLN